MKHLWFALLAAPVASAAMLALAASATPIFQERTVPGQPWPEVGRVAEGLSLGSEGTLWVADAGSRRILRVDGGGRIVATLGGHGTTDGHLLLPIDVVEAAGRLVALDRYGRRLVEWDLTGPAIVASSSSSLAVEDPVAVEPMGADGLLVLDAARDRILVLDSTRRVLRTIGRHGKGRVGLSCPHDMVLSEAGVLYVADAGNRRIQRYELGGRCLGPVRWPRAAAPLTDPTGVALDARQRLLVADHYAHEILRLEVATDGSVRRLERFRLPEGAHYPTRIVSVGPDRAMVSAPQLSRHWELDLSAPVEERAGSEAGP